MVQSCVVSGCGSTWCPNGDIKFHAVKAERVNALRKQYDAFLEEDKKRKERNEYILGRLENMRYGSTAVQIRHKPIVIGDVMSVIPLPFHRVVNRPDQIQHREVQPIHSDYQINRLQPRNLQIDIPRTHLDSSALLREITKKYILIPKLRSSVSNDDYVGTIGPQSLPPIPVSLQQTVADSKEDWKSKYEILEQLKKKEKEELAEKYGGEELFPVKEKQAANKNIDNIVPNNNLDFYLPQNEDDSYGLQSYDTKDSSIKYEQEPPEKDSTANIQKSEIEPNTVDRSKVNDSKIQEPNTEPVPTSSTSPNINPEPDEEYETYDGYNLQSQGENYAVKSVPATSENYVYSNVTSEHNQEILNNTQPQINYVTQQEEYPVKYEQPIVSEGKYPDNENVYLDPDDYSPIQVVDPLAVADQIHRDPTDASGIKREEEITEYPVEMLNVQDFTPKEGIQLIDGVNVNPKHNMASNENIDPTVYETNAAPETAREIAVHQDTTEIEAFDAEQKEMFYSEDTAQYDYNQQQAEGYNAEYAAPQEDSHYESPAVLQEQEYPVEINEHEESTTRYDQNYEEQYGQQYQEQQEYAQPAGYEQTDQQYVQEQGYEQTDQQYGQQEGYDQTNQQYGQQEGYDQTNQQYGQQEGYDQTDQQYVQQEGYDQTDQQYVQPEGYDQADQQYVQQEGYGQNDQVYGQQEGYDQAGLQYQQYEYQQQNQDTVQNIEQVLDNEQGYNNDVIQADNIAEPHQQAVDQNAS